MKPVILISAPWALYNRPSIQLGALKAFLRQCFPELPVQAEHFHLQAAASIGYPLYQAVSKRTWIAECVAATLIFPERFSSIETLFIKEGRQDNLVSGVGLNNLKSALDRACEHFLEGIDWERFGLAGFSVSLCQLTCSLYLIRRVKERFPELPIVVGGSTFSGESPEVLSELFPDINYLIRGEGEAALADLVGSLCLGNETSDDNTHLLMPCSAPISDLNTLPMPDFDEYFRLVQSLEPRKRFFPVLPIEASRGCWWKISRRTLSRRGCAFCNLNLQWKGYRKKSPEKIAREIDSLSSRYKVLSISFMDNLLPRMGSVNLFNALAETGKQFRLFGEIRADTPLNTLKAMRRAGMRELQVGIEALSSSLLNRMGKGTSTMDNIEAMRHCEALGINHGGNLLLNFPGSSEQEIRETLHNLDYVCFYRPLNPVSFWLGLESPVYCDPEQYGISLSGNDPRWDLLFPLNMARKMRMMIQGYKGGRSTQNKLWNPVRVRLEKWAEDYAILMRGPTPDPVLSYQDGRDFLIIIQRRTDGTMATHRLTQTSRRVYLFCRRSRSRQKIQARFSDLAGDKLNAFLQMMIEKQLMFGESERFLSLAIPFEPGLEDIE